MFVLHVPKKVFIVYQVSFNEQLCSKTTPLLDNMQADASLACVLNVKAWL